MEVFLRERTLFLLELEAIKEEIKQLNEYKRTQKKLIEIFEEPKRIHEESEAIINHNTNVDVSEKVEPQDLIRTCLASEDLAVRWELNVDIFLLRRNLQRASCVIDICLP